MVVGGFGVIQLGLNLFGDRNIYIIAINPLKTSEFSFKYHFFLKNKVIRR